MRARPSSLETKLIALSLISAGLIAGVNETQAAGEINGRQFWTEITNVCTQTQIEHGALKSGYSETAVNEYCACYSEKLRAKLAGSATQLQDLIDRKDRKAADRFLQSESAKKLAVEVELRSRFLPNCSNICWQNARPDLRAGGNPVACGECHGNG